MTRKEAAAILRAAADRRLCVHVNGRPHEMEPDEIDTALRMAIEALERDLWISVEERLPEKYGEYMILWKPKSYRTKTLFYEITEYEDGEWIGKIPQSEPYGGYEVFYWRELPEPPKEET